MSDDVPEPPKFLNKFKPHKKEHETALNFFNIPCYAYGADNKRTSKETWSPSQQT